MTINIEMGSDAAGRPVAMDVEELLATRLLVQGNSGSGKSHLLRRMLEESAGVVQQIVIDPEGDFVTLSGPFGHLPIEAGDYSEAEIARIATRVREHRVSVVLSLEGLELEAQMRCAAAFLAALFDAPRDHWYPALVVVDEAQLFAPAVAGEVSDEARRASLGAMTNLMCRGRKRGLAGVIATQRLAKLAKNVAAEASNFLMGRTFLDIDMARAADLLGMERRQAEAIRDLARGQFLALGPAISRRPVSVNIGMVRTSARSGSPKLVPLPATPAEDMGNLILARDEAPPPSPPPPPAKAIMPSEELLRAISRPAPLEQTMADAMPADERASVISAVLAEMAADPEASFRPPAVLYQDFQLRCRMRRLTGSPLDLAGFRRRIAMARAGIFNEAEDGWADALAIAAELPEDMMGAFLLIARAAREGREAPGEDELAEVYGTRSPGRIRRLIAYMESQNLIVVRKDLGGKRSIGIPRLGWTTAAAHAEPDAPPRPAARPADNPTLF